MRYLLKRPFALLALAAIVMPATSGAATFGAETNAIVAECTFACIVQSQSIQGGEGATQAFSNASFMSLTSARARALVGGSGLGLPSLGAEGLSLPGSQGTAIATAMRHYSYSGPLSSFTLVGAIDGELAQGGGGANISAYLSIVEAPDLAFDVNYAAFTPTIVTLPPTATLLAAANTSFFAQGLSELGPQTATFDVDFELEDGASVFLLAYLVASGSNGGTASAYGTLSLDFSAGNVAGLTGSPVPVPAAVWLLLGALGLLGRSGIRRPARR